MATDWYDAYGEANYVWKMYDLRVIVYKKSSSIRTSLDLAKALNIT